MYQTFFHTLTAPPQVLVKSRPIFANPVNINWYNVDEALHNEAAIKDIAWAATRLSNPNEQDLIRESKKIPLK